jgi:hypothetical protein
MTIPAGILQEFKTSANEFFQELFLSDKNNVVYKPWFCIKRFSDDSVGLIESKQIDSYRSVQNIFESFSIERPASLNKLISIITNSPDIANLVFVGEYGVVAGPKAHIDCAIEFMARILSRYLDKTQAFKYYEVFFEEIYSDLFKSFSCPNTAEFIVTCPLIGIQLDIDELTINKSIELRMATDHELEGIFNGYPFFGKGDIDGLNHIKCILQYKFTAERNSIEGLPSDIYDEIEALVLATKLHLNCHAHIVFFQFRSNDLLETETGSFPNSSYHQRGEAVTFSAQDINEVLRVKSALLSHKDDKPIRLALRRWDSVSDRNSPDDEIIDYWIGLESLFAPDMTQEVTYRVSLRIAAYVGNEPEKRNQLFRDMKSSYGLRSTIVHGAKHSNKHSSEKEQSRLTDVTRDCLRVALIKILEAPRKFDANDIDTCFLNKYS